MEVIIIAAVALLVLVILSVLLIRSGVLVGQGTSCSGVGGYCSSDSLCGDAPDNRVYVRGTGACTQEGTNCCIPLGTGEE